MKELFKDAGVYAAKWGLTDFYEAEEQELREAIESGEDFTTGWYECKKEIRSGKITRMDGKIYITVSAEMDDLYDEYDLIYDALCEVAPSYEDELPEEIVDSIIDAAIDEQIDDHNEASDTIPGDSTYDEILRAISKLESEAEELNTRDYTELKEIVKAHLNYMKMEV